MADFMDLGKALEENKHFMTSHLENCSSLELIKVLKSYGDLSEKLIEREYKRSNLDLLVSSLRISAKEHQDSEEILKLCDFYNSCVDKGTSLTYASRFVRIFQNKNLIKESFDDFSESYFEIEDIIRTDILLEDIIIKLINVGNSKALKQYYSFIIDYHDHNHFEPIANKLSLSINYLGGSTNFFTSCLSKVPEILLYKKSDDVNNLVNLKELAPFYNEFELFISDYELKHKVSYLEMNLIKETRELIMVYLQQVYGHFSEHLIDSYDEAEDLFFNNLNKSISYGETLDVKRHCMTYWCKEV